LELLGLYPLSAKGFSFREMCTASVNWICPNCGAFVTVPEDLSRAGGSLEDGRLDRLARVLCGCWVSRLSDTSLARLVRAVIIGDDAYYEGPWPEVGGSD